MLKKSTALNPSENSPQKYRIYGIFRMENDPPYRIEPDAFPSHRTESINSEKSDPFCIFRSILKNLIHVLCPFINFVFGPGGYFISSHPSLPTLGRALVGGHSKPQEGNPGLWYVGPDLFYYVLLSSIFCVNIR